MEFVYCTSEDSFVAGGPAYGSSVHVWMDQIWWADDPFVLARPDLFSATPCKPHSTTNREYPERTAVEVSKRGPRKATARG